MSVIFKVWEEKYIPAEEADGFVDDCKTTGEEYKQVVAMSPRVLKQREKNIINHCGD